MAENERRYKFPIYFYNWITYLGVALALFVFIVETILFGIDFFSPSTNAYLSLLTFCLLPPFLIIGLILIPIGALRKRKRIASGKSEAMPKAFVFDPSIPFHFNAFIVFFVGSTIFLAMTVVGTFSAYEYTESVHFCGTTCHHIMTPEFTAYSHSPHARVRCVECHIGPGVDFYVKSKLAGLRQVYKTVTHTYPAPIETPIKNLRPASETCEKCHWPDKSYTSVEMQKKYYAGKNTETPPWYLRMLIKIGNPGTGIHSHMFVDKAVYYVADDVKRQKISWIKSTDKDGKELIFTSDDSPYKDKAPDPSLMRKMDCIDCHNRPSHHYQSPSVLINQAMTLGKINSDIPQIKSKAMELLSKEYPTNDEAVEEIESGLMSFYKEHYSGYFATNQGKIVQASKELTEIFKDNFFPAMKTRWDVYPDNIGHLNSTGCFRCHDGEHHDSSGNAISKDCRICHTIIEQGPAGQTQKSTDGLEFQHPFSDDGSWKDMNCSDCHTGGAM